MSRSRGRELEFPGTESGAADLEVVDIASSNGDVWISTLSTEEFDPGASNHVYPVNPETNEVGEGMELPGDPTAIAADDHGLWLTYRTDGKLRRIDSDETLDVETTPLGGTPLDTAAGKGGVWVTVRPR